jgi:SP family xylose:H+ symportor-like MFS transporter
MTPTYIWAMTVAVGGFLFGFDVAVISGADQPLQKLWQTSDLVHGGFVMSSALWGTVFGALLGNKPADRFGRKPSLFGIGILYLLSALGSALSDDPYLFSVMRFIGGVGVGMSSVVVPAYISEISPAIKRGRLVAMYQFQIVFGILISYLSNYVLTEYLHLNWRWLLGVEAIPAAIFLMMIFTVPESPRWLLLNKQNELSSRNVLSKIDPASVDETIADIRASEHGIASHALFKGVYSKPILLAFAIAVFNQLSGINFVIYFAPRVFELAGLDNSTALLSSAGIGLVNLVATMAGMVLIDKLGRKTLMLVGSLGYIISLAVVTWAFANNAGGILVVLFIFLFIAAHAVGQGAVIWVFIAEIFPNTVRTKGQSLGCGTHWILAALVALMTPYVLGAFSPATIFGFFGLMMVLQLLWVIKVMPETRGKSLEALQSSMEDDSNGVIV